MSLRFGLGIVRFIMGLWEPYTDPSTSAGSAYNLGRDKDGGLFGLVEILVGWDMLEGECTSEIGGEIWYI